MRIAKVQIHNFRSIRDIEFETGSQVVLLGPNNHGKSNILAALEYALTPGFRPSPEDFFAFRDGGDNELWVELTFDELTEQEQTTFKKYVQSNGTMRIRKIARLDKAGKVFVSYHGYVEEPIEEWLQQSKAGNYISRESINETPLKGYVPPRGRITKAIIEEAQQKYIQEHKSSLKFRLSCEEAPLLGQKNVASGILPDFYLIPAVRDVSEEVKIKAASAFGRLLLRAIQVMAEHDPTFMEAKKQLEEAVTKLNRKNEDNAPNLLAQLETALEEELQGWGVKVNIGLTSLPLEKLFEIGTVLKLDDGVETTPQRKGHGLQRALMFALIKAWAREVHNNPPEKSGGSSPRKKSDSLIIAIEEPELYLHPHAQRRLAASLREIAKAPHHQVFLSTHSTHFIDLDFYKEIVIVNKPTPSTGTTVRQYTKDIFSEKTDRAQETLPYGSMDQS